ncbi:MAG: HEPN domain-containing protein [Bacteroidota bacterium]
MPSPKYSDRDIERAHHWIVRAIDALEEARVLIPSGRTRLGAYSRLYYSAHHTAVALLRLIGNSANTHDAIKNQFGKAWVTQRGFPVRYGALLKTYYEDRRKADYGEYVPTMQRDLEVRVRVVDALIHRAQKQIPPISMARIITLLVQDNPTIRDFSFDFYCPRSYHHHTRFTVWCPKGRLTDRWLRRLLASATRTAKALGISDATDYVLGINSRVNQYEDAHLLMLDFDNVSSVPYHMFASEPGFFFRTHSGFHFLGGRLYRYANWKKRMRRYSRVASRDHCELSLKRGYGTLRITASRKKPVVPAYVGRSPGVGR